VAARLGCGEHELIRRIDALLQAGVLTRFARCTMPSAWGERSASPPWQCLRPDFDRVAEIVNAFPEVAQLRA
jgi:siroheme decarboxylase